LEISKQFSKRPCIRKLKVIGLRKLEIKHGKGVSTPAALALMLSLEVSTPYRNTSLGLVALSLFEGKHR
jgi:hypothetical protein